MTDNNVSLNQSDLEFMSRYVSLSPDVRLIIRKELVKLAAAISIADKKSDDEKTIDEKLGDVKEELENAEKRKNIASFHYYKWTGKVG